MLRVVVHLLVFRFLLLASTPLALDKGNDEDEDENEDENIYWQQITDILLTIMTVLQYFIEEVIPFFYYLRVLYFYFVVISTFLQSEVPVLYK
jgi:hypothetical protein